MNKYSAKKAAYHDMMGEFSHVYDTWERIDFNFSCYIVEEVVIYSTKLLKEEEVLDMDEFHYQCDLNPLF